MQNHSVSFKTRDAASYEHLTEEFDRFTQQLTRPIAERLLKLVDLKPFARVLDVGTGTGIVALLAAQTPNFSGTITAVDLSDGMLTAAKRKAADQRLGGRLEFCRMDAEQLLFGDGSFDVVLSLFALLHFPNPQSALREMFRVMPPGGRLALAIGSGPPRLSWAAVVESLKFLKRASAVRRGKLLVGPRALDNFVRSRIPEGEAEESSLAQQRRKRADTVTRLVREEGFSHIHVKWLGTQSVIETPAEFWEIQRTFSSIARKRLLALTAAEIQGLRDEFVELCREVQARGGKLVYPFAALYVLARRPA